MTLAQAADLLVLEARSRRLSPATIRFYEQRFANVMKHLGADLDIRTITVHELRAYLTEVRPRCAPLAHTAVKRLFSFLVSEEIIKRSPADKLARPKVPKLFIEPLTMLQLSLCYKAAKSRWGYAGIRDTAIFATFVGTGIRRQELCELKNSDVNLQSATILVNGKGQRQRQIPISSRLQRVLAKYLALRSDTRRMGNPNCIFFFRDRSGNQLTGMAVRLLMARLGRDVGIKLYPHLLRHTFCSHFMSHDGADVLTLQAICGWTSLAMANRYAHIQMPKLHRSMEAFSPINDL